MRIKLDENLPELLVAFLNTLNHDTDSVRQEGLVGRPDPEVWQAAQSAGRFLITQDLDFSDMRKFAPGIFQVEDINAWAKCFVLVTDTKVRVHHPKT